ncbi:hypothetical protein AVEN_77620-1 [Araneus ventricosus]|uniref:Integrase catalytic domain-containing protein n=1 Tax=Araneus ventricosus TaxID=182803 RepID=A0A4Y2IMI0_ARAVE|nr:hypothetical protein AVEN_77620-1 [Araneus ventricosus]
MSGMKAETYVQTFLQGWIARFGVPEIVTTNRGSQFESELFQSFTRFLGSESIRITSSPAIILIQTEWYKGDFFRKTKPTATVFVFLQQLKSPVQNLQPVPASIHTKSKVFIHKDFSTATHVSFRCDIVRRLLEQPYDGPYKVLSRTDKVFTLEIHCQQRTVTVDS